MMFKSNFRVLCSLFLLITLTWQTTTAALDRVSLEAWFDSANRDHIHRLHERLAATGADGLGGWDFTTVWDVRQSDYTFEGLRVMRILTDSQNSGSVGCCYGHSAGLVLELTPAIDLSEIAKKYDCYRVSESIAIAGLHFHGHSDKSKGYAHIRCPSVVER